MASFKLKQDTDDIKETLQTVYDTIKNERPWDIRPANKMYTTAKEKYMILLIKEGYAISDETINHVVGGGCFEKHILADGVYGCCCGFIITEVVYSHTICRGCKVFHEHSINGICLSDYLEKEFECTSINRFNKYLLCHSGYIYYPVDMLSNPFGEWQPDETKMKDKITFITMVNGANINDFLCLDGVLNYEINLELSDFPVVRSIPVTEPRSIYNQTDLYAVRDITIPDRKDVKRVYERICQRDLISLECAKEVRLTWSEQHLIDHVMLDKDIPNEVISHALEGCHIKGHLLTEKYACCRGYILERDTFFQHDLRECGFLHDISTDLKCCFGNIYHRCDNLPNAENDYIDRRRRYMSSSSYNCISELVGDIVANPRPPPRPAPPPPDHLDNAPVQHPFERNLRPAHPVVADIRQDDNEVNDEVGEAIVRNVAPYLNRHPNAAPPPPEHDI